MNTNKHKNYLVIKNVCSDKNLVSYLEQICQDENVSILYEEFNQFDIWNQKQSVYANFNAKNGSDILLWSYDSIKLEYINYLYKDFEARYKNTGNVVNRIIESVNNEENFDEDGELVDVTIQDNLSSGWTINWNLKDYLSHDLSEESKESLRKNLNAFYWGVTELKKPTFKQKISNFYNKHVDKIMYLLCGIALSNIFFIIVLTLKYFAVK